MATSPKNKGRASKKAAKEVVEEHEEENGSESEGGDEEGYETNNLPRDGKGKKGPVKKGRPSATAQKKRKADADEMEVDQEEAPKKQTKRGRPSKPKEPEPKSDAEEEEEEEEEPEFASMDDYLKKTRWDDLIKEIETVEHTSGELIALITRADGQKSKVSTTILAERCPQMLITFYETHLKWRPTEEE
ncbi:unnamed protein product [Rhizoctonia solani]|uniref:Chromo shadow domain-containing protein n=1 Tax=Rhizoctonia solani TaxID=456999 RepID=A0A8H3BRH4_9AGAM|nr:unnamed protein product [Rhizoctonia solani]